MSVEFVGIELELRGADAVYRDLEKIEAIANSLGGKKKIKLGMTELKQDAVAAKGEIQKLEARLKKVQEYANGVGKGDWMASKSIEQTNKQLETAKQRLKDIKQAEQEVTAASGNMGKTLGQIFNSTTGLMRQIGSGMITLGKTLDKLSSPFKALMRGTVFAAGYKLLGLMTEGLNRATQRADILATYKPVFRAMGAGLDVAGDWESQLEPAYNKVYDSVVGLPTGIDEIVNEWKLLTIATQDYDKAADLAIAANNAILASGADDQIQTTARRELRTLLTTGKLTERQWDSLRKGIPVAWNAIEQDLKKSGQIQGSLLEALKGGDISANQFADLLINEGINGKTKDVVLEMLHTYNAATANITNAFSNMGKNILATLDEVLKEATGKDTIDYLIGMKELIGNVSQGIQDWIRANPEVLINFLDALKGINWKSLLEGFGEGLKQTIETVTDILNRFEGKDLSGIGKFLAQAPLYAQGLTLLGGAIKGLAIPIGLLTTAIVGIVRIAKGGKIGGGLFGILGKLFGGGGAAGAGGGSVIGAGINKGTFMGVGKIGLLAGEITAIVGVLTTMVAGFAALDMKLLNSAFKSFREMMENLKGGLDTLQEIKSTEYSKDAVKDVIKAFEEVYAELDAMDISTWKAKRLSKATEAVWTTIHNLRRVAYQINQAADTTVNKSGFATFVGDIAESVQSIKDLNEDIELDIKVVIGAGFKSSVDGVVKTIKNARKQIQDAVNYISEKTFTTTVRVTVKARVNMAGAIKSISDGVSAVRNSVPQSTGGLIYRARGGNVPFRRRGTDTVPAMLTPGEYVHNKQAVNTFGIDFMRKVNNLDVRGAMGELMAKAGRMANVNRNTTIHNTYNNNQKVVQNISTNSPGFTFKAASRFVGAF